MPKITRLGGASNEAGLTRAHFGGQVDAGLTERASGFVEDTAAIRDAAGEQQEDTDKTVEAEQQEDTDKTVEAELPFDPSVHTVAEVNLLLQDCDDAERELVLDAEREGQNRTGIVGR